MKSYYFPIQSTSLAHYFATAIIKPAKYFDKKIADIQDRYKDFLLFTTKFGTTETDCCLEIVLTDDEIVGLIDAKEGWFLFDEKPLPVTRIKRIYFSNKDIQNITITNIKMSSAYIPDNLVGLHDFDDNPTKKIHIPTDCYGINQEDKIRKFDRFLGASALMKTAREPYMNYSPNYIKTISVFNSLIHEQINKISRHEFKSSYQGLFTGAKGFAEVLPYLNKSINEDVLFEVAIKNKQQVKKDKISHVIDINGFDDTWTYTFAIMNNYGVGDEARRKKIDGLIISNFSEIRKGKAEGVALCYGYNRGYSAFSKDYGLDEKVSFKYKLESQLDYYTIESIYQYVFNDRVSTTFPYLDEWCPKQALRQPTRKTDYIILDEIIIGERRPKVFSEEWQNRLFPKFIKEFGRLAKDLYRFFQELNNEMKEDLEDERKEIVTMYEEKLSKSEKLVNDLTRQIEKKNKEIEMLQLQVKPPVIPVPKPSLQNTKTGNLKDMKVSELKELAKQRGISIPKTAKKGDIVKLLAFHETASNDMFSLTENK